MSKMEKQDYCIADAVSYACGIISDLASECREVVDGASGTPRENTSRIQTLDESATALENVSEPEVHTPPGDRRVSFFTYKQTKRGLSRRSRLDDAVSALQAVQEDLETRREQIEDSDIEDEVTEREVINELKDAIDEIVSNVESLEFPGMMG